MKSFKLHHKVFATILATAFAFQSMSQINEHTYTIGINNIHIHGGGCLIGLDIDYSEGCFDPKCILN